MATSQKKNSNFEVVDEKERGFFIQENEVVTEYLPIMGVTGYALYGFYSQMANRKKDNSLYPSMQLITAHLGFTRSTISRYNWLLEYCGLLRIETGQNGSSNIYYLLPVNPITPKLLAKLAEALQPDSNDSPEWARFKANRLEAVQNWQPLSAHFKGKPVAPKGAAPAPVQTPPPAPADLPRQTELIAYMTTTFHDGKKPLSEAAAIKMIETYGLEAVERQISWLERRNTDNPLRTLRAALKNDWNEPKPIGHAQAEPFTPAEKAVMMARMNEPNEVETEHALSLPPDDPMPVPDATPNPAAIPIAPAPEITPPDPLWQEVKERLRMQLSQATYDSWVRPTELAHIEGQRWLIECESTFAQDWLENRLNGTLTRTVKGVVGHEVELQFIIRQAPLSLSQMNES